MRSSKSRSRSKQNRPRSIGNIVNRVFDSSGPEGKVRGTPQQIIEKYQALARDAQLSNDRVAAENFLQHAEHYTRMLGEAMRELAAEQDQRRQGSGQGGNAQGYDRPQHQPRRDERVEDDQPEIGAVPVFGLDAEESDSGLVETPETRQEQPIVQEPRAEQPRRERGEYNRNDRYERRGDNPRGDNPRGDNQRGDNQRGELQRGEHVRQEQPRSEQPRNEQPRSEQPRQEQPRHEQSREDRRDERGDDRRPSRGPRSPRVQQAPTNAEAPAMSEAPAAAPRAVAVAEVAPIAAAPAAPAAEAPVAKPRRPRAPRKTANAEATPPGNEAAE